MAVGQERKDSQGCSRNNKYNAQIFCGGMEYLIGQVAAHRTAQHFQGILVDDSISANQNSRYRIQVFEEGNKICKSAVNTIDRKNIK